MANPDLKGKGQMDRRDIKIRVASAQDAQALLDIYTPYVESTAVTFEYEVPSLKEFTERICRIQRKYPYLVAEVDGEILGYAYADAFHERPACGWAVETSIYVSREKKRMGIGSKLYQMLEKLLAEQNILNLNAAIAYPEEEDEYLTKDSVKFHQHLGYCVVGEFHQCGYKFRRWYHLVWMEKHIGIHQKYQPPVKTFDEIKRRTILS